MSQEYAGKDPLALAEEAERNLNSKAAQQGVGEDTATRKDPGTRILHLLPFVTS